jgi:hypothetical protein
MIDLTSPLDPPDMTGDNYADRMRLHRDRLLAASDWAMTSDAPTDKQAWETYRQALRDFPLTWTPGPTVEFPEAPQ